MGMGRRTTERQQEFWVPTHDLASAPRHVFYERLNQLLAKADFDQWIEERCAEFYAPGGRDSIPPGTFFRMVFIGYFEGIDSQRGIAWRCADSLSLKTFLGYAVQDETPDHSSMSRIRWRLPKEVFDEVFQFVLQIVEQHKLLDAKTVGVDSTTLEANAAMKSIVRKDTGENWEAYLKRLAAEDGVEIKSKADLIRYDKQRNDQGKKKVPNDVWESPSDSDARIAKMKDGTTHLAYKAEHVVDLQTCVILAAEIYHADQADTATLTESLTKAQENLDNADIYRDIEKVAADKGYHDLGVLVECELVGTAGIKTYIPEREGRYQHTWDDKPYEQQRTYRLNRRRTQRDYGKRLQKRRSEVVERSFAHTCETGGARRTWLRERENVGKRYLMQAAAHNLGCVLRKLLGAGKPREYWGICAALAALRLLLLRLVTALQRALSDQNYCLPLYAGPLTVGVGAGRGWRRPPAKGRFSTGC